MRDQDDKTDIEGNLIEIRRYLETHARVSGRSARPPAQAPEEDDRESFRYAEYGDGRRPRFSRTDLILITLVVLLAALVVTFIIY